MDVEIPKDLAGFPLRDLVKWTSENLTNVDSAVVSFAVENIGMKARLPGLSESDYLSAFHVILSSLAIDSIIVKDGALSGLSYLAKADSLVRGACVTIISSYSHCSEGTLKEIADELLEILNEEGSTNG